MNSTKATTTTTRRRRRIRKRSPVVLAVVPPTTTTTTASAVFVFLLLLHTVRGGSGGGDHWSSFPRSLLSSSSSTSSPPHRRGVSTLHKVSQSIHNAIPTNSHHFPQLYHHQQQQQQNNQNSSQQQQQPATTTQWLIDKTNHLCTHLQTQFARHAKHWSSVSPFLLSPSSSGTYYGLPPNTISQLTSLRPKNNQQQQQERDVMISETLTETLHQVQSMRKEMEALRRELQDMKRQVMGEEDTDNSNINNNDTNNNDGQQSPLSFSQQVQRHKRQHVLDQLSREIEAWSSQLLFDTPEDDASWTRVQCHKSFQHKGGDRTIAYLKWMKDSRGKLANPKDDTEYPCLRMYATIDAPLEDVCSYLAQPDHMNDYNHLLEHCKDLEQVSSHSKICLGETPQILFVQPREFITYCSHRWRSDGTQIVVNQAMDDNKYTSMTRNRPRAFAFRGANYIGRHPDFPDTKTRICMLAHGSPGADVPNWAMKTAVKTLTPLEPFKLFYKINEGVQQALPKLREEQQQRNKRLAEMVVSLKKNKNGVSPRPAGLSQLGYACFWPQGGGIQEQETSLQPQQLQLQQQQLVETQENEESSSSSFLSLEAPESNNDPPSMELEHPSTVAEGIDYQSAAPGAGPIVNNDGFEQPETQQQPVATDDNFPVAAATLEE
jgi:hypothetical protein